LDPFDFFDFFTTFFDFFETFDFLILRLGLFLLFLLFFGLTDAAEDGIRALAADTQRQTPLEALIDVYLFPSLPNIVFSQHSFAGYGGESRDKYFFVVCLIQPDIY